MKSTSHKSLFGILLGLWLNIHFKRRIQLGALLIVMIASAFAELISLGSLIPFLAALTDLDHLWQNIYIKEFAGFLHLTEPSQLLMPVTVFFSASIVISSLIRLLNLWMNGYLSAAIGSDLSCETYRRTLYQPYINHIRGNSSQLINTATNQINLTVVALSSFLQSITSLVIAIILLIGLVFVDKYIAITSLALFSSIYLIFSIKIRKQLQANGRKIAYLSGQQVKALQEGLGAIRDVLLDGTQPLYLEIYRNADRPQRKLLAQNIFIGASPRFILESIAMISIAILGSSLVYLNSNSISTIPLLGTLALGAQRLLPAFQSIYRGWASLKGNSHAIVSVLELLDQDAPVLDSPPKKPLEFTNCLELKNVSFKYSDHLSCVLNDVSLTIKAGEKIGIVGKTGSGKSTTVDLLMGLLRPTNGSLFLDGIDLYDPKDTNLINSWRSCVTHVPQSIFLSDATIAENIAFGVSPHLIDMELVYESARKAQISEFIENGTSGYQSRVGERGIRLSGGQRQRLAIARALYKKPTVIVLDEATSALDTFTEAKIMEEINSIKDTTIIIVAHRTSTLDQCDRIFSVKDGKVFSYHHQ